MSATGAVISGAITATSGTIGGFTIGATYLYAGSGGNTVGLSPGDWPFWAGDTYANRATAPFRVNPAGDAWMNSATIAGSSTLNLGQIAGGTGAGAKFQWVGGSKLWEDTSARIGVNSIGSPMYIYVNSGEKVIIPDSGQVTFRGGGFFGTDSSANSGHINAWGTVRCGNLNLNQQGNEGSIDNVDIISGYNDIRFVGHGEYTFERSGGGNGVRIEWGGDQGKIHSYSSTIDLGGTDKTAIVPIGNDYRALYCVESPEVWFMDFCESKDKIDPMFLEVTVTPYHFIKCEDGEYQVWGKRKGHESKRFETKTFEEFKKNEQFLSMAKVIE